MSETGPETLDDWSDEQQKAALAIVATAQYGVLSESIRGAMAEARLCSMFCGGKNCKYESDVKWKPEQMAIKGLYSHWVTSNILAMARPNTEQIKQHDIINQFLEAGIQSIINLQMGGEHASCGPGLEPGGFVYVPQDFMDNGVFFYNFGWHDYNVGSLKGIADAVHVMQFALSRGKVAVHCHAGHGRTGVLIACYLVYANRLDPDIAINYVRRKRPGAVQSRCQLKCIRDFAEFLRPSRIVFSSIAWQCDTTHNSKPKIPEFTLSQFLSRQRFAVHGDEDRRLRYLPKIVYICCERLLELASRSCSKEEHRPRLFITSDRLLSRNSKLAQNSIFCANESPNSNGHLYRLPVDSNVSGIPKNPLVAAIAIRASISCESILPLRSPRPTGGIFDRGGSPGAVAASMTVGPGTSGTGLLPSLLGPTRSLTDMESQVEGLPMVKKNRKTPRGGLTASVVADILAEVRSDYPSAIQVKVDKYKQQLNMSPTTWWELKMENEPRVLAGLMWDWLDELREPVLSIQELPLLLDNADRPTAALNYLDKGARQTVAYLFYTIACLEQMSESQRSKLIQRAASTLTQQNMTLELDDLSTSMSTEDRTRLLSRSTNDGRMKTDVARKLYEFCFHYLRQIRVCSCIDERLTSRRLELPPTPGKRHQRTGGLMEQPEQ